MGRIFDVQFAAMREALGRRGIDIAVEYTASGQPDYLYQAGRLLVGTPTRDGTIKVIEAVTKELPGAALAEEQPRSPILRVLSIEHLAGPPLSVPAAISRLHQRKVGLPAGDGGFPSVTPVHIMHIASPPGLVPAANARICPATEPEAPGPPGAPWPPLASGGGTGVVIGICDTGLLAGAAAAPWLGGVLAGPGDTDPLGPLLPLAPGHPPEHAIPLYCGHGTFAAGVARSQAPAAVVQMARDFVDGGEPEWMVLDELQALLARTPAPQVVNLSAGTYTAGDWPPLSFLPFSQPGQKGQPPLVLTAAAGNDGTNRPFWPAAFDWATGVGALGPDQASRAWFSNYGDWVDVFAPGEDLVNAFATGRYTYQWPPQSPAVAEFAGLAKWSGTSFAAPMVAGLIATAMTHLHASAPAARDWLVQGARNASPGLPVLLPWPAVNPPPPPA